MHGNEKTRCWALGLFAVFGFFDVARAQEEGMPPAPPPPNMEAVAQLRQRFELEPTVAEVQREALKFFRVHPDKVEGYRAGAEWKALMPDVEFTFNNEIGDSTRTLIDAIYRASFPEGKEFETNTRSGVTLGLRAHWALDRLIFNPESLDVTSLVGVQEGLLREITSLYFTRRRLMTFLVLTPPQDPGEQITESIRLEEVQANIDALTGGFLTEELKRRFGT